MTIIEVLLALALLGGTVAMIGELARLAFQNARQARDLIQAELLAESFLAKVQLGILPMEPVFNAPVSNYTSQTDFVEDTHAVSAGNVNDVLWFYSIEIVAVEVGVGEFDDYLVEIAVTVCQNVADMQRPAICRLVRWLALEPEEEEEQ
jgi:type II secretory pathway pseudopilin PulG